MQTNKEDVKRWQVPGNANPFGSDLKDWKSDKMSMRSIGVLEFVKEQNPTKKYFIENIKDYLLKKYNLKSNNSNECHFYRPLEFVGLVFWNDERLYLSIDGKIFLQNIYNDKYKEAKDSYILQLLKTTYPSSATPNVELKLFPYRVIFKLLMEKTNITDDDFTLKIPYISCSKDIVDNYDHLNGPRYAKLLSWTVSYLQKWGIIILENGCYKINLQDFPIFTEILEKMSFEDMFFEEATYYQKSLLRQKQNRNHSLAKDVISKFNFKCFFNTEHITFETNNMPNYLEAHHVVPMSFADSFSFNLDIEDNIIPLCPNCHRKMHLSTNVIKKNLIKNFYNQTNLCKHNITESDLVNIYVNNIRETIHNGEISHSVSLGHLGADGD
jgi:5-methylcytosine-specific restriction protein A